jgi:basic membrane protein A
MFKKALLIIFVLTLVLALIGCGAETDVPDEVDTGTDEESAEAESFKVAFIYAGPVGDSGWYYQHDQGRQDMDNALDFVETTYLENVPIGADSERVMAELADDGYQVIICPSIDFQESALNVAKRYPDVVFLVSTGDKVAENVGSYYAREYEAFYLQGMLAGELTKTNVLGVIGAFPYPIQYQNINAYTLGARSVNPNAEVRVVWINTFYDPTLEREAALSLLDSNADVIMQQVNSPAPLQAAEERGVFAFGINTDMSEFAPKSTITSTIWDWGAYYTPAVQQIYDGTWVASNYLGGLDDNFLLFAPLNPEIVNEELQKTFYDAMDQIIAGNLKVFAGPIKTRTGEMVVDEGQVMSDDEIRLMTFFVEGVVSAVGD